MYISKCKLALIRQVESSNVIPQIAHLLEEDFIEQYTDDIRELAGHVNLLAKIVKNDKTKGLGLHLYDEHLKL